MMPMVSLSMIRIFLISIQELSKLSSTLIFPASALFCAVAMESMAVAGLYKCFSQYPWSDHLFDKLDISRFLQYNHSKTSCTLYKCYFPSDLFNMWMSHFFHDMIIQRHLRCQYQLVISQAKLRRIFCVCPHLIHLISINFNPSQPIQCQVSL